MRSIQIICTLTISDSQTNQTAFFPNNRNQHRSPLGSISEIVEEGEGEHEEPAKKIRQVRFSSRSGQPPSEYPQHFQKSVISEIVPAHHQPQSAAEADASSDDRMVKEYDRQYGKIPEGFEERKGIAAFS
ncbi:hypothetical protein PGT21_024978 [Puccinia graminis f. sp. tritici]|uniref:Uncharacterized protein n=1 Tax=Puccinia graminis f. sp. tritici TaxID=56615 RepID=A0A5B0NWG4_PUCGR|nr:hypothetical protein PGT21_024978 [Puccinia graminis f. sp. tritici]KAA1127729.1 hypothetical protein PGTUg99_005816 [Puccinia graminis f. sp. tritici]